MKLDELPNDILLHIFYQVQIKLDYKALRSICSVNRRWFQLASPVLWRNINLYKLKHFIKVLFTQNGALLHNYFEHVRSLTINCYNKTIKVFDDEEERYLKLNVIREQNFFSVLLDRCKNLSSLMVYDAHVTRRQFISIVTSETARKNFKSLSIKCLHAGSEAYNAVLKDDFSLLQNLRELSSLRIDGITLSGQAIVSFITVLKNLTRLEIEFCDNTVTDYEIITIAKSCPHLCYVSFFLPGNNFTGDSLIALARNCKNLSRLRLPGVQFTVDALNELLKLEFLEYLDLCFCSGVSFSVFKQCLTETAYKCLKYCKYGINEYGGPVRFVKKDNKWI